MCWAWPSGFTSITSLTSHFNRRCLPFLFPFHLQKLGQIFFAKLWLKKEMRANIQSIVARSLFLPISKQDVLCSCYMYKILTLILGPSDANYLFKKILCPISVSKATNRMGKDSIQSFMSEIKKIIPPFQARMSFICKHRGKLL